MWELCVAIFVVNFRMWRLYNNIGTDQLMVYACSFTPVNQIIYYGTTTRTADAWKSAGLLIFSSAVKYHLLHCCWRIHSYWCMIMVCLQPLLSTWWDNNTSIKDNYCRSYQPNSMKQQQQQQQLCENLLCTSCKLFRM